MVLGKLASYTLQSQTTLLFTPYTRINSKWFKDLNVRPQITKLVENTGSMLFYISLSNAFFFFFFFLDMSPWLRGTKAKINKWDYVKLKSLWQSKGICQQNEKAA